MTKRRRQRCAVSGLPAGHKDACGDCDPCIDALAKQSVDRIFQAIARRDGEQAQPPTEKG